MYIVLGRWCATVKPSYRFVSNILSQLHNGCQNLDFQIIMNNHERLIHLTDRCHSKHGWNKRPNINIILLGIHSNLNAMHPLPLPSFPLQKLQHVNSHPTRQDISVCVKLQTPRRSFWNYNYRQLTSRINCPRKYEKFTQQCADIIPKTVNYMGLKKILCIRIHAFLSKQTAPLLLIPLYIRTNVFSDVNHVSAVTQTEKWWAQHTIQNSNRRFTQRIWIKYFKWHKQWQYGKELQTTQIQGLD